MAILALIVTPLVMSIIRKAKVSADKRSVDAYGRSIKLAIAGYLMDNGSFPTSMDQLTVEYSGDRVVCSTTQIKSDSSVYLAGCTVGGRSVEGYIYGKDGTTSSPSYTAYSVGDTVTYNNINYYVIKDSSASEDSVTRLKAEPLTAEEITTYSAGTGAQTYGNGMQYHSSNSAYSTSFVKQTVDAWKTVDASAATEARLVTIEELTTDLGCTSDSCQNTSYSWLYNINSWYYTMSEVDGASNLLWGVNSSGDLGTYTIELRGFGAIVRPVIVLPKSAL